MSDHGEPRFDIQMRCMCAPFSNPRSQTCTSGFNVSVTVLQLGNRPYNYYNFSTKTHLQDYTSQTPGNTPSVHTHGNFNPRAPSHHHTTSTSVCLSENLSYEFIIISVFPSSIFDYELDYHFFWTKATLYLAYTPFPDEAAALSVTLSSLSRPLPPLISAVSPLSHTLLLMCTMPVKFLVPAVSLHLSHFTHIVSRHTCTCIILHMHIPRYHISFQSHTDMFMKTTQEFRLATNHTTQFTLLQIR